MLATPTIRVPGGWSRLASIGMVAAEREDRRLAMTIASIIEAMTIITPMTITAAFRARMASWTLPA